MKLKQEKITYPVQSSFKAVRFTVPKLEMPFHFHPEYELVYIFKGEGLRYVGESVQKFKSGDLVFIGPDLAHVWRNKEKPVSSTKAFVLQFPNNLFDSFKGKPEFDSIEALLDKSRCGIKFYGETRQHIIGLMDDLMSSKGSERLINLIQLLDLLAKEKNVGLLSNPDFTPKNKNVDKRIHAVHNFVHSFYRQKISIGDAASIANMEQSAFCRFFKEKTQKTFIQFLNERRIDRACRLLLEKNLSIGQIAYECGFVNRTNFYRQFKSFTGQTPAAYQKE